VRNWPLKEAQIAAGSKNTLIGQKFQKKSGAEQCSELEQQ
jgi:hypothetical protein